MTDSTDRHDTLSRTGAKVPPQNATWSVGNTVYSVILNYESGVSSLISCHFAGLPNVMGCIDVILC